MLGGVTAWSPGDVTEHDDEQTGGPGDRWARYLGQGRQQVVLLTVGLFALYLVVDRWTGALATIDRGDLSGSTLIGAALAHRWYLHLLTVALAAGATVVAGRRCWCSWDALDHGWALRRFVAAAVVALVWRHALYDMNYLAGQAHLLDRWLVVGLGAAAVLRPAALVPFIVQIRVVADQFDHPLDATIAHDLDTVLLLIPMAAAAAHFRYVATRRTDTSDAVLVVTAGVAAQFFVSGWAQFRQGWLDVNNLGDLPLAAHTAGWLGGSDGWWADGLTIMFDRFGGAVLMTALVIELAAPLAALRPRLAKLWLPFAILFHLAVFAVTGLWFLPWLVVEIGLLMILWWESTRRWVAANIDIGRGLLGVAAATLGASVIFHPAAVVWLSAPVSYGYRFEAVGVSGERYHLPVSAFAPLDRHIATLGLQLGPITPASGAYGSVASVDDLRRLEGVHDLDALATVESSLEPPSLTAQSEELIRAFVDHANADWSDRFPMTAPSRLWTSSPDPTYRFDEPIAQLEAFLVAVVHDDGTGEPIRRETLVLVVEGTAAVETEPDG
jgi:hypothetical protein